LCLKFQFCPKIESGLFTLSNLQHGGRDVDSSVIAVLDGLQNAGLDKSSDVPLGAIVGNAQLALGLRDADER
jgi:hypothetical protein